MCHENASDTPDSEEAEAACESCLKPRMGEKMLCSRGWCVGTLGCLHWLLCNEQKGSLLLIFSPQGMELARKGRSRVLCVLCSVGATSLTPARECVWLVYCRVCALSDLSTGDALLQMESCYCLHPGRIWEGKSSLSCGLLSKHHR